MTEATERLQALRMPGDVEPAEPSCFENSTLANSFLLNDLLVQPEVLPGLDEVIRNVHERLGTPRGSVQAFVYAHPHFQAECYLKTRETCAIRISSSLVSALTEDELAFVVGHELGHFLLRHLWCPSNASSSDLEALLISRRRELSCDRIGLLACQSLSSALSAMMKTMSGLSERHLKLDVAGFVSQINSLDTSAASLHGAMSTHPAFVIRCRALLWFSMSGFFQRGSARNERNQLEEINSRIAKDLDRFLDQPILDSIASAVDDFVFWSLAAAVANGGSFSKRQQQIFVDTFGAELTSKLKALLGSLTLEEAVAKCLGSLHEARSRLELIAPLRLNRVQGEVNQKVEAILQG